MRGGSEGLCTPSAGRAYNATTPVVAKYKQDPAERRLVSDLTEATESVSNSTQLEA